MVLIGSASIRRRHFESRKLLNSYPAGAHCDLVTHDVSALFSVQASWAEGVGRGGIKVSGASGASKRGRAGRRGEGGGVERKVYFLLPL